MAKEILESGLATAKSAANKSLETVRVAHASKDLEAYGKAMAKLKDDVADYNTMLKKVAYDNLGATESPMIEAVKQFYVEIFKIQEDRDDAGNISGINLVAKKSRIDLEAFCKFNSFPTKWATDAAHLLDLLALKEIDVFKIPVTSLTSKSVYFLQKATEKKSGATPDSNTQIVKLLQTIIDEMIFVDDGAGKNAYKCTSHDLIFIHDAITKFDAKEKCTIQTMNARQFNTVLMSVLAHCLGEAYTVKAAKSKAKA